LLLRINSKPPARVALDARWNLDCGRHFTWSRNRPFLAPRLLKLGYDPLKVRQPLGSIAGVAFVMSTGTTALHVPYKGSSQAHGDLITGRAQIMFDTTLSAMPQIRCAGRSDPRPRSHYKASATSVP
jgi:hypothetical protein